MLSHYLASSDFLVLFFPCFLSGVYSLWLNGAFEDSAEMFKPNLVFDGFSLGVFNKAFRVVSVEAPQIPFKYLFWEIRLKFWGSALL